MSINCYNCSTELLLAAGQNTSRSEECPKCYANIHSCKMCEFHDATVYNECKETTADRILEKEKANFCDFFNLNDPEKMANNKENLMSAADALFKK